MHRNQLRDIRHREIVVMVIIMIWLVHADLGRLACVYGLSMFGFRKRKSVADDSPFGC